MKRTLYRITGKFLLYHGSRSWNRMPITFFLTGLASSTLSELKHSIPRTYPDYTSVSVGIRKPWSDLLLTGSAICNRFMVFTTILPLFRVIPRVLTMWNGVTTATKKNFRKSIWGWFVVKVVDCHSFTNFSLVALWM